MTLYLGNTLIAGAGDTSGTVKKVNNTSPDANGNVSITIPSGAFASKNMCTTTPTTSSTASNSNPAVVTQNYRNGSSWYRVWSDNWCEQGGIATGGNNATGASVSFIKTFANTNYSLYASGCTRQSETFSNQGAQVVKIRNLSTTGFNTATSWVASSSYGWASYDFSWYACGYIS